MNEQKSFQRQAILRGDDGCQARRIGQRRHVRHAVTQVLIGIDSSGIAVVPVIAVMRMMDIVCRSAGRVPDANCIGCAFEAAHEQAE